eukprot:2253730-Amphidinium_carterae.1
MVFGGQGGWGFTRQSKTTEDVSSMSVNHSGWCGRWGSCHSMCRRPHVLNKSHVQRKHHATTTTKTFENSASLPTLGPLHGSDSSLKSQAQDLF